MQVISIRETKSMADTAICYIQNKWGTKDSLLVYENCIHSCLDSKAPLPQWYLLTDNSAVIGCAGLITNDFISHMDLYPWLCALYIEENHRGNQYSAMLIERIKKDSKKLGFDRLYSCTDHISFYEKYGFSYLGDGFHPWGEGSRIYRIKLE